MSSFEYLFETRRDDVITTAVKDFKIPEEEDRQFVIVWSYHDGEVTADTYKRKSYGLLAWDGDDWCDVAFTAAYNPEYTDPGRKIIAIIKKH